MWAATQVVDATVKDDTPFQSTLPVWAATPLPPKLLHKFCISIHAARVGSDWIIWYICRLVSLFQSTLPVWAATNRQEWLLQLLVISIHAARVGSDLSRWGAFTFYLGISIHAARVGSDTLCLKFWY